MGIDVNTLIFPWLPMAVFYGGFYLVFVVPPLFLLRARVLDDTTRAVWALAMISVPIVGVLAFLILQPGQRKG